MLHLRVRGLLCAALVSALAAAPASAGDVLDMYFGAGIGESQAHIDSLSFNSHDTGWKALFGVRALEALGGEVEYVDLGRPHGELGIGSVRTKASGPAVFAVGYLPLPVPFLDVYGKVGLANIQQQAAVTLAPGVQTCALGISCGGLDRTESEFAWGAGAQVKSGAMSVRAEFEQFRAVGGSLNFASVGFYWHFL